MTFEKAELILEQLMAGDKTKYLVRCKDTGRAVITDRPDEGKHNVIGCIKKAPIKWLTTATAILLMLITPWTVHARGVLPTRKTVQVKNGRPKVERERAT